MPGIPGEVGDSVGEVVTVGEGEGEGLECVSLLVATVSLTTCVPFSSGFGALSFASATCPDRASSFLPSTPGSGVTTAAVSAGDFGPSILIMKRDVAMNATDTNLTVVESRV